MEIKDGSLPPTAFPAGMKVTHPLEPGDVAYYVHSFCGVFPVCVEAVDKNHVFAHEGGGLSRAYESSRVFANIEDAERVMASEIDARKAAEKESKEFKQRVAAVIDSHSAWGKMPTHMVAMLFASTVTAGIISLLLFWLIKAVTN